MLSNPKVIIAVLWLAVLVITSRRFDKWVRASRSDSEEPTLGDALTAFFTGRGGGIVRYNHVLAMRQPEVAEDGSFTIRRDPHLTYVTVILSLLLVTGSCWAYLIYGPNSGLVGIATGGLIIGVGRWSSRLLGGLKAQWDFSRQGVTHVDSRGIHCSIPWGKVTRVRNDPRGLIIVASEGRILVPQDLPGFIGFLELMQQVLASEVFRVALAQFEQSESRRRWQYDSRR